MSPGETSHRPPHVVVGELGVDLRRDDAAVVQRQAHEVQVAALSVEPRREAVPESVRRRRDKASFSPLVLETLAEPWVADLLAHPRLVDLGLADGAVLRRMRAEELARRRAGCGPDPRVHWPLWHAVALELWLRDVGGSGPGPEPGL